MNDADAYTEVKTFPYTRPTPTAPKRRRKEATMAPSTTPITADDLAGDPIEAVRAKSAPYARMRANGKTLAYADDRKNGVALNFAGEAIKNAVAVAPVRFQKMLDGDGGYRLHVTAKNVKGARSFLEWLAKQTASSKA